MRAVIQRVTEASVTVDGETVGAIGPGLMVLVGVGREDGLKDAEWLAEKIVHLRIFERDGKFDQSLLDTGGELLAVSQFTLFGDCSRGRRPSFSGAMEAREARDLFGHFVRSIRTMVERVECGIFQTSMKVSLVNDGPVTILFDTAAPG